MFSKIRIMLCCCDTQLQDNAERKAWPGDVSWQCQAASVRKGHRQALCIPSWMCGTSHTCWMHPFGCCSGRKAALSGKRLLSLFPEKAAGVWVLGRSLVGRNGGVGTEGSRSGRDPLSAARAAGSFSVLLVLTATCLLPIPGSPGGGSTV